MNVQVELRHLRAFIAVAEELHFTRAAERLHLAQQALSGQIRQLEEALGAQLFERSTRKVELTEAGRVLLERAAPVLDAISTALEETQRVGRGETGRVAVCYAPTAGRLIVPRLVRELHERYPDVKVHALVMWQTEAVEAVTSGRFDVGLSRCPADLGPGIECEPIQQGELGVILSDRHPLADREEVPVEELSSLALVIWPREFSPSYHDWVVDALRARGFAGPVREFENSDPGLLLSDDATRGEVVACEAFGVGYPRQYAPLPPGLVWRPMEPRVIVPMHMFWRHGAGQAVRNFVAVAREISQLERWMDPEVRAAAPPQDLAPRVVPAAR